MTRIEKAVRIGAGTVCIAVAIMATRTDVINNYNYGIVTSQELAYCYTSAAFLVLVLPTILIVKKWKRWQVYSLVAVFACALGFTMFCSYEAYRKQQDNLLLTAKDQQESHDDSKADAARNRAILASIQETGSVAQLTTLSQEATKEAQKRCDTQRITNACKKAKDAESKLLERLSNANSRDKAQATLDKIEAHKTSSARFAGDDINRERAVNMWQTIFAIVMNQMFALLGGIGSELMAEAFRREQYAFGNGMKEIGIMKISAKHKAAIRAYYPNLKLKFQDDGTVLAQKTAGGAWGVLYTPRQTEGHIATLKDKPSRVKKEKPTLRVVGE